MNRYELDMILTIVERGYVFERVAMTFAACGSIALRYEECVREMREV